MSEAIFTPVAGALGVKIYAPKESYVSFCSSPYPAHRTFGALDIYPAGAKFNDEVACPVNGIVRDVKKYSSPSPFSDKPPIYEYLTLIESAENPSVYVKIIHACPKVGLDKSVSVGEKIAVLIRSGYYPFWVEPHIHVELRDPNDSLRALGSHRLSVLNESDNKSPVAPKTQVEEPLTGIVTKVGPRYATIRPSPEHWATMGNFSGLRARADEAFGLLDGGIPFLGYGALVTNEKMNIGTPVYLNHTQIGIVNESFNGLTKMEITPFKTTVNDFEYQGISSRLCLGSVCEIKLIPLKVGQIKLEVGQTISINKSEKHERKKSKTGKR